MKIEDQIEDHIKVIAGSSYDYYTTSGCNYYYTLLHQAATTTSGTTTICNYDKVVRQQFQLQVKPLRLQQRAASTTSSYDYIIKSQLRQGGTTTINNYAKWYDVDRRLHRIKSSSTWTTNATSTATTVGRY